jgi:hypothetical protein
MPLDANSVAGQLYEAIDGYVRPLVERIAALEARLPERGEKGDPGEPGPVGPSGEAGPVGPIGDRGEAGEIGEPGPPGEAGKVGETGPQGERGERGEDGAGIAAITREGDRIGFELSDGRVFDAGELPRGERGERGKQGLPGRDGRDGLGGPVGERGAIGEKGETGSVGPAGERGPDGFGFNDLDVAYDGERRISFRFVRGGEAKEFGLIVLPMQIYRGIYAEGKAYERGDTVTWSGSLFHCNENTMDKPGAGSKAWTLASKRGADGRHGKDGERGPPGPEGRAGRDLTQRGPNGERW